MKCSEVLKRDMLCFFVDETVAGDRFGFRSGYRHSGAEDVACQAINGRRWKALLHASP